MHDMNRMTPLEWWHARVWLATVWLPSSKAVLALDCIMSARDKGIEDYEK